MSLEHLKEYARRCATEDAVGKRAKAIELTDLDEHIRHARSLGLEWTLHDLVKFRNQVFGADAELEQVSDEELKMIAGGVPSSSSAAGLAAAAAAAGGSGDPGPASNHW